MTSQKTSMTLCIQITCCTGSKIKKPPSRMCTKTLNQGGQFAMQCPLIMEAILETLCGKEVAKDLLKVFFPLL